MSDGNGALGVVALLVALALFVVVLALWGRLEFDPSWLWVAMMGQ